MLKIGVFDSGIGGLTVVKALNQVIQNSEILYVADTKHAPYGEKTPQQILHYALDIAHYLVETYKVDALVLACNTATAFAIKELREQYPHLIIIGTEPGVKPAIEQSKTGKIGVLATPATLQGDKYQDLVQLLSKEKKVTLFEQACAGLVEQIEKGEVDSESTKVLLTPWLLPMKENGVDTIVLGCTHYPLVGDLISSILCRDVVLIDTGLAIAKHLLVCSLKKNHQNVGSNHLHIEVTGDINEESVRTILGKTVDVVPISISNS